MSYAETYAPPVSALPLHDTQRPPTLHWMAVLVATIVTFGLFQIFWMLRQAWWVKRIDAKPKAFYLLAVAFPVAILLSAASVADGGELFEVLSNLVMAGAVIIAYFDMKSAVEARYGVKLSGLMTFFFNVYYLQYHLRRIARGEHVEYSGRLVT